MTAPAGWVVLNRDFDQIRSFRDRSHNYDFHSWRQSCWHYPPYHRTHPLSSHTWSNTIIYRQKVFHPWNLPKSLRDMISNPPWRDVLPGQRVQPHPLIIPREEPVPLGPVLGQVGQRGQLRGDGWVAASFLCIWISVFWGWTSHHSQSCLDFSQHSLTSSKQQQIWNSSVNNDHIQ